MKWVRRIVTSLFSIILLICLLGTALSISANTAIAHPSRVENWLDQSHLYANLLTDITNQAQSAIENNVSGGGAISKKVIISATRSSFPQSLLKQNITTFINSNYAWLEGKTSKPEFKIDLSEPKQKFATDIANASVLAHLKNLPTCTAAQTLQLKAANPLLLSCTPAGVSSQVEITQVAQQINNTNAFLNNPIISADTVSTKGLDKSQPYYKKLSTLPKAYRTAQKLPWILGAISLFSALIIIYCARTKRFGLKIIASLAFLSGVLLMISKFAADAAFNKLKKSGLNSVNDQYIKQSLITFTHFVEKQIASVNLCLGLAYVGLALVIVIILVFTRNHVAKAKGGTKQPKTEGKTATADKAKTRPNFDMLNQPTAIDRLAVRPKTSSQQTKKRSPTKPPRLIQ